jgi:tRNA dimethylallyltransferase
MPAGKHATRAAARERRRHERFAHPLERQLRGVEVLSRGEHEHGVGARATESRTCVGARAARAGAGVRGLGEAGADPHSHAPRVPRSGRADPRDAGSAVTIRQVHPPVLAIFGPTGIGKTDVAIALAERLSHRGERPVAVSVDALQVYEGLGVLTGQASPQERGLLEHRLQGFVPVTEPWTVAQHARRAHAEIDALLDQGAAPIVVGGTGLYLRAALAELELRPPPPPELRAALQERARQEGPEALHRELPAGVAERVQPTDTSRVIRALELAAMGQELHTGEQLWTHETRHPTRLVALTMDRDALYARIDARVDAMVAAGAAEEVRAADAGGAGPTARKALGFTDLLDGDVDAMKRRTRQYARRQLTWLRKLPDVELVDVTDRAPEDVAAALSP